MSPQRRKFSAILCCAGLAILYATTSWFAWLGKSPTYDEPQHFVSAWAQTHDKDFFLNSEDPPLWKYFVTVGTNRDDLPLDLSPPRHTEGGFSFQALYAQTQVNPSALLNAAHARMIFLTLALASLIAWWAWRLAGPLAAIVAMAFFTLDPNFLAHGPLVKDDVPMAFSFLALMAGIWAVGEKASLWRIVFVCLLLAAAPNVKFSGILGIPLLGLALLARALLPQPWPFIGKNLAKRNQRLMAGAAIFVASLVVTYIAIWACYAFRFVPAADGQSQLDVHNFNMIVAQREVTIAHGSPIYVSPSTVADWETGWQPHGVTRFVDWLNDKHLLPQAWLMGFLFTYGTSLCRPTFFCGELGIMGWWYYFPMAMAFKTPLATIGSLILAAISLSWSQNGRVKFDKRKLLIVVAILASVILIPILLFPLFHPGLREYLPIYSRVILSLFLATAAGTTYWAIHARIPNPWPLIATAACPILYLAVAMNSHLNLGIRHMLPVYPFLFIFLGVATANASKRWPRAVTILIASFLASLAVETFAAYPDFIPFFNATVGGSRGGLHLLSDSNIDWGQELPDLANWQTDNPARPLYLLYFGFADPRYYKIRSTQLTNQSMTMAQDQNTGTPPAFAISAVALQGSYLDPDRVKMVEPFRHMDPFKVLGGSLYLFNAPPKP